MSAPAVVLFAMTDASGVAHLVTDKAMAMAAGRYAAVCGGQVLAATLTTPKHGHITETRPVAG